ncbi:MAG: hypothetical protein PHH54_00040 [Candidatus Nanoarchaeia archaeon]|nr:hypothetical protein [Candidatus Nanoarchaeia archaeon]MDD5740352.1 hypothetical protein [Candidatus Nanoarchaeia archaeon]
MAKKDLEDKAEGKIDGIVSRDIINWIHKITGDNYKEIGKKLGLSESSASRIRYGDRAFTLCRLKQAEQVYNIPLPLIFLLATKKNSIPRSLRSQYDSMKEAISKMPEFGKYL